MSASSRRTAVFLGVAAAAMGAVGAAVLLARRRSDSPIDVIEGGERTKVETSDGAVLDVHIAGEGPTVVFAHCWGGSMDTWAPVAFRLLANGHRVVRYDQRGHGGSSSGSDEFTIERLGADLREVLEGLDLRDIVLAAHSLGGMGAQAFAIAHPDVLERRVRALLLVATASTGVALTRLARYGHFVVGAPLVDRTMRSRYGSVLVRGALGKGATRSAVRATRDLFVGTAGDTRIGLLKAMVDMDLLAKRSTIRVPTTVVGGTRDTLTPFRYMRELADDIPGARFVRVPGAGHMLPYEAPDLLTRLIEQAAS